MVAYSTADTSPVEKRPSKARLEPIEHVARFLALYRRFEYDWTPLDRVCKARGEDDMKVALYTALRRKDRITEKLKKELIDRELPEGEAEERAREAIPDEWHIRRLLEDAKQDVSSIGKTLAILASSWDVDDYIEWLTKRGGGEA